jgi:hypothetical protein
VAPKLQATKPETKHWQSRRRPNIQQNSSNLHKKYEELVEEKIRFVKIQREEWEKESQLKKERDEEEFNFKKKLLELEIKKKELEINKLEKL